jgi:histidinol dehydrogenase
MKIIRADDDEFVDFFRELRLRGGAFSPQLLADVVDIIRDVTIRGDEALFEYTAKFDGHQLSSSTVEVTAKEKKDALARVAPEDLEVIKLSAKRIEDYHRHQIAQGYTINQENGVELQQIVLPLRRVGIYAPGGKASYPSTLLMAAIPARIAGV